MVNRWEGILQARFFGSNLPARVMASLLFCPRSCTLLKPSKNAVLFMGDCVQGSGNPVIERLSQLDTVSSILLSKLGDPLANVWVVEASRFNGAFACYEGFLPSMSSHGEPLFYNPHGFPAARAISSLLRNCLIEVKKQLQEREPDCKGSLVEGQPQSSVETRQSLPKTLLCGFSKGGVVLNQLLSEISSVAAANRSTSQRTDDVHISEIEASYRQKVESKSSTLDQALLLPSTVYELLASIVAIHYIDVGLNSPGAYPTNTTLLENVVRTVGDTSSGLHLGFHGTPRQWKDLRRPWIASEKDGCIDTLRRIAQADSSTKITVSEKIYFDDQHPSLQMHFEILECFELD